MWHRRASDCGNRATNYTDSFYDNWSDDDKPIRSRSAVIERATRWVFMDIYIALSTDIYLSSNGPKTNGNCARACTDGYPFSVRRCPRRAHVSPRTDSIGETTERSEERPAQSQEAGKAAVENGGRTNERVPETGLSTVNPYGLMCRNDLCVGRPL